MFYFNWRFYTSSQLAWEAMLIECQSAKKSIDIEHYIFASDRIGGRFIEVLKEKSKEGVVVRILLDMVGSFDFYNSSVPEELRKSGIEVKFFNIISPWRIHNLFSWFLRDHKKILVVDEKVGFTGGLGIRDNMTEWRDITARLEGNVVGEMRDSFLDMWMLADSKNLFSKVKLIKKYVKRKDFITNDPYFRRRYLYHAITEALRGAKKNIYITTPYFIPDRKLSRVLRQAVRRGVDVKILLPLVFDVPIIGSGVESTFETTLRHGIKIFRYQPVFLHTKTIVVDDAWATFGSSNMDNLSFRFNHEANAVTNDRKCVNDLTAHFYEDLKNSKEVVYKEWRERPLIAKMREFFISKIRSLL